MKKYIVIAANLFVPGLGSLVAKKMTQGVLQLLIAGLGVLLWSTGSLRLAAVMFLAFAWIWSVFSALRYKREAELVELHPVSIVERRSIENLRRTSG